MTVGAPAAASSAYVWYVVVVLMLCQVVASIDARLPFILVEALKRDLQLTDTQLGLITGPAFSLTYAVCAIPIAKLSDRRNRVIVLSIALVVWSCFTAVAALAAGFVTFALTRAGVAIGESALTPAAHSIIANYLHGPARAKAFGIYSFGVAAGALAAFALGGYIGERYGWRMAFMLIGGGGTVLAVLLLSTIREPLREIPAEQQTFPRGNVRSLLRHPVIRNIIAGGTLLGFSTGALNAWGPAYVMRTFDMSAPETGFSYGAVAGLVAMIGTLGGGFSASWLSARKPHYTLQMLSFALVLAMAAQMAAFLATSYGCFLLLIATTTLLTSFYLAPTFTAIQSVANPSARSFTSAVTLFCINGIGVASGAFVVGVISDILSQLAQANSLKWALLAISIVKGWSAFHFWKASRHLAA